MQHVSPVHQAAVCLDGEHFPKLLKLQGLGHLTLAMVIAEHHEVVSPIGRIPVRVVLLHMRYRTPHQI